MPPLPDAARKWGNVARRGARLVGAADRAPDEAPRANREPPAPMDRWVRADGGESEWEDDRPFSGPRGARRAPGPRRNPVKTKPLAPEVAADIRKAAVTATAHHREVLVHKMEEAIAAYDRGRHPEAARLAKQVANETPSVAAVRELAGLAAYRSGRWREALRQLEAYEALTDDGEHIPARMDCERALGHPRNVAKLWTQLRKQSPGPDVLAEARMVAAGSLADRGDLDGAISLLATAGAAKALRNPADRHLRQWYALGDLYERAGDLPRARELFLRVLRSDPTAYDVDDRLEALGPARTRTSAGKNRRRRTTPVSTKERSPDAKTRGASVQTGEGPVQTRGKSVRSRHSGGSSKSGSGGPT